MGSGEPGGGKQDPPPALIAIERIRCWLQLGFPWLWHGCDSPPRCPVPPQEYTMLCLLCGRAEDSISILPDDPRQMTPLF